MEIFDGVVLFILMVGFCTGVVWILELCRKRSNILLLLLYTGISVAVTLIILSAGTPVGTRIGVVAMIAIAGAFILPRIAPKTAITSAVLYTLCIVVYTLQTFAPIPAYVLAGVQQKWASVVAFIFPLDLIDMIAIIAGVVVAAVLIEHCK